MDVNDDDDDWEGFESGQPAPAPKVDPFAARLSVSKPKVSASGKKAPMKLGMATKSSALRVPMGSQILSRFSWRIEAYPFIFLY